MVVPSLAIGGTVGVLLSGGFIWWEVGRFATPQVPVTLFDERRLLAAYTVGLFVGVPLAVVYLLFQLSLSNAALLGAAVFLIGLVAGAELAQALVLRTRYWGGSSGPFYALALRSGVGAILALTVVTNYLGGASIPIELAAPTAATVGAVLALEVTGALVTLAPRGRLGRPGSRPASGVLFGLFGFFLVGIGAVAGALGALAGSLLALAGALVLYRRLRPLLAEVPPPGTGPAGTTPVGPSAYGRTGSGAEPGDRPLR